MNKNVFYLFIYLGVTLIALVIQTALWSKDLQNHGFFPQMIIPLALHFFLYSPFLTAIYFIYGITLLTASVSTYSFAQLFISYSLIYLYILIGKNNYHWQDSKFFFISSFVWSLLFPFVLQTFLLISHKSLHFPSFFPALLSASVTLGISFFMLPLLNSLRNKSTYEPV